LAKSEFLKLGDQMKKYGDKAHRRHLLTAMGIVLALPVHAVQVFTDDFTSGSSPLWGNETGNWAAGGGVYNALNPFAANFTSVPFTLTDFVIEVDINDVYHSTPFGRTGRPLRLFGTDFRQHRRHRGF
jgi:hypothetical protein